MALAILVIACDREAPEPRAPDDPDRVALSERDPLVVRGVEVAVAPGMAPPTWAPGAAELREQVLAQLQESDALALDESATEAPVARILYGAATITPPNAQPHTIVGARLELARGSGANVYERMQAEAEDAEPDDEARRARLEGQVSAAVEAAARDLEVARASDERVVEMLTEQGQEMPREAAVRAIGRARAWAGQDPARRARAAAALRPQLERELPQVVVPAAAALVALEDRDSERALVEAASRMSEQNQPRAYVALLTQMGQLGGEEIRRYLQTVHEGHENEQVRQLAGEALEARRPSSP